MKNDRFSCIYADDRHEELRNDGGGVYHGAPQGITLTDVDFRLRQDKMSKLFCAWFALKFHRDGQLHALSCKYPLCK